MLSKAERTRKLIIEKSAPLINRKGIAGTYITDIMAVTNLTKGGIYGNFESKDEICLEAFTYLAQGLSNNLDKLVNQGKSAKDKLYKYLDFYAVKSNTDEGCPLLNFGIESDDTHPVIKEKVKKEIIDMQKRIFEIIAEGITRKEILASLDPQTFSVKVFAMIEGGILIKKMLNSETQLRLIISSIKKEFEAYLS